MAVGGRVACEGPRGAFVAIGALVKLGEVRGVPVTGARGACPVCERGCSGAAVSPVACGPRFHAVSSTLLPVAYDCHRQRTKVGGQILCPL